MTTTVHITGIPEAVRAFGELPPRLVNRHLRIALNAGGGILKTRYAAMVPRDSQTLSRSMAVKVTIPNASKNPNHHGKPAYVVVGVKRGAAKFVRRNSKGNLKGYGAANRELVAERKRLAAQGTLSPLQREREAVRFVKASFSDGQIRRPSRYAHLAGKGRDGGSVLNQAVGQSKDAVLGKIASKLGEGIDQEARALSK